MEQICQALALFLESSLKRSKALRKTFDVIGNVKEHLSYLRHHRQKDMDTHSSYMLVCTYIAIVVKKQRLFV